MSELVRRMCSWCHRAKPQAEFRFRRLTTRRAEYVSWCRSCERAYDRIRQQDRREARKAMRA